MPRRRRMVVSRGWPGRFRPAARRRRRVGERFTMGAAFGSLLRLPRRRTPVGVCTFSRHAGRLPKVSALFIQRRR